MDVDAVQGRNKERMEKCMAELQAKYTLHAAKPVSEQLARGTVSWAFVIKHYLVAWPLYALNMYLLVYTVYVSAYVVDFLWESCFGVGESTMPGEML